MYARGFVPRAGGIRGGYGVFKGKVPGEIKNRDWQC